MIDLSPFLHRWRESDVWHERMALGCVLRGHYQAIPSRRNPCELYLLRVWLSAPVPAEDGVGFRSSSSRLLHFIAEPDADGALHDHPWDFATHILSGGYVEELPGFGWDPASWAGPRLTRRVRHGVGAVISHNATDLHRIASVEPDTWTLVNTGRHVRAWGFHPPGQAWKGFTP